MLKELWRKLGADFMQADDSASADCELRAPDTRAEGVKVVPHITHTGEFHLERLTHLLKARYGKSLAVPTHTGVSDHTLKDVISFAARIQDQDVQRTPAVLPELLTDYSGISPLRNGTGQ